MWSRYRIQSPSLLVSLCCALDSCSLCKVTCLQLLIWWAVIMLQPRLSVNTLIESSCMGGFVPPSPTHTHTHTHTHTGYETLCVDIGRLWSTSLGQRQSNTWVLLVMCIWTLVEVCVCVSHLTLPCLARTGLVVCVCVCPTLPYLALQDEPGCVLHSMNKHWRAMWEWL